MENLLTPRVIKAVLGQYEESGVIFNEFKQDDYANISLGEFIDTKVLKTQRTRKVPYSVNNTIRDKPDFCLRTMAALERFDDLSPEAKDIATRLYDFIAFNNK